MKRKQISICLDKETMEKIRHIAKVEDRSLSYTINVLLDRSLALCYDKKKPIKRTKAKRKTYLPKPDDIKRFDIKKEKSPY